MASCFYLQYSNPNILYCKFAMVVGFFYFLSYIIALLFYHILYTAIKFDGLF